MQLLENKTCTDWKIKKQRLIHIKEIVGRAYEDIRQQIKNKLRNAGDNSVFIFINMYLDEHFYKQKKIGFYGCSKGYIIATGQYLVDYEIEDFKEFYSDLFFFMEGFNEVTRS